jgi:hypothetical protein
MGGIRRTCKLIYAFYAALVAWIHRFEPEHLKAFHSCGTPFQDPLTFQNGEE